MALNTGSRSGQSRPGGRSARVGAAVLTATVAELATSGYAGFSLEAVAERAGVHKTTIYRRWGTRESLILDAMLDRARHLVQIPDTGSLVSDLIAYGTATIDSIKVPEVDGVVRAVVASGDRNPALAEASRRFWDARFEINGEIVRHAIARGEVPPETDPRFVMEALTGPIYFRLLASGKLPDAEFVERVARLVACGARSPARRGDC